MGTDIDRRAFLKVAGLGAALGAIALNRSAAGEEQTRKWPMRLSTSSIHFMQLPIEQACERIAALGFEAIDIWSAHEGCPHLDDVANRLGPEGLRELLKKHRLRLCGFSVYSGGYEKYAELLGKADGGVAIRGSDAPCKPQELTSQMRRFIESLKPSLELAEKYNSYLAIENHGNALLDSLDSLKALVEANQSPRLGIALAPCHLQAIKASVPEAIHVCGKQLFFFYAWQQYPGEQQLPGIGPTDMKPWLHALAQINYRRYVNPFMHGHPEPGVMSANLGKAREYLLRCRDQITTGTQPDNQPQDNKS